MIQEKHSKIDARQLRIVEKISCPLMFNGAVGASISNFLVQNGPGREVRSPFNDKSGVEALFSSV